MYYISINPKGHYDIWYSRKMRKLEIHVMYGYRRERNEFTKTGTYTTEKINQAIEEKQLWRISLRQANKLRAGGSLNLGDIEWQNNYTS